MGRLTHRVSYYGSLASTVANDMQRPWRCPSPFLQGPGAQPPAQASLDAGAHAADSGALDKQHQAICSEVPLCPRSFSLCPAPLTQDPLHLKLKPAPGSPPRPPWDPSGTPRKVPIAASPAGLSDPGSMAAWVSLWIHQHSRS